jgi:hypothetical protein
MPNHYSKNTTGELPCMKKNWKGGKNNTNENRDNFLNQMRETPEYRRKFNPRTGKLKIWFVMPDDNGRKIILWNTRGSCTITIECFSLGKKLSRVCHEFNPLGFSYMVNAFLLTPEDLEQQRAFEQQEQDRKDALKRAHYSSPQTCGGVDKRCEHCINETIHDEICFGCRGT